MPTAKKTQAGRLGHNPPVLQLPNKRLKRTHYKPLNTLNTLKSIRNYVSKLIFARKQLSQTLFLCFFYAFNFSAHNISAAHAFLSRFSRISRISRLKNALLCPALRLPLVSSANGWWKKHIFFTTRSARDSARGTQRNTEIATRNLSDYLV